MTFPGIERPAAAAILSELGSDMSVFLSAENCAPWAGYAPATMKVPANAAKPHPQGQHSIAKHHDRVCLTAARTHDCQFKDYHKSLTVRRDFKRAAVATAHKMLRAFYWMLQTGECYRDSLADYEITMVRRNAPMWIHMLKEYGYPLMTATDAKQPLAYA